MVMKRVSSSVVVAVLVAALVPAAAHAQRLGAPGGPLQGPQDGAGNVTPGEIQRMFDAYALLQAQEQLKIGDEQYTQFLSRFKALQDIRRRALNERMRIVVELRRMLMDAQPDETIIKDRLKTLDDIEARSAVDVKKAYEAIDQILDVRQQAKFRVFEENMERRKLELVTRARLANRQKP